MVTSAATDDARSSHARPHLDSVHPTDAPRLGRQERNLVALLAVDYRRGYVLVKGDAARFGICAIRARAISIPGNRVDRATLELLEQNVRGSRFDCKIARSSRGSSAVLVHTNGLRRSFVSLM